MAGGRGIYNLLRGRLHSHSAQPKPLKNLNGQICQICGEAVGLTETGDIFVACNECAFPICRSCYEYERREGNQLCPLCKTRYRRHKGIARVDGDDDEDVVDDLENEFNYPIGNNKARHEWQGDDPGLSLSAIHESQQPIPRLTNGQQVSGEIPSVTDNLSVSTSGPLGPGDKHVRSLPYVDPRQPGELAHALRFLASVVSQSFLAFGDILELHRKFIELSGAVNRIFELEELLDAAQSDETVGTSSQSDEMHMESDDGIFISEVDIITPSQKLLARKLTCDIVPGKSLLLTGPNGSGKSSVFRALRGLWPIVSGRIDKPSHNVNDVGEFSCGILYIPQKPYTCLGTLRDQIIYPLSHDQAEKRALSLYREGQNSGVDTNILDVHLRTILENVKLSYLFEREGSWEASQNWEDILSLGEQQRLGMARLFFHKPRFGVLDECTNATSVDVEEHLYRLARDLGITVITSSQRPALIPFHSMELRLIDGEGRWELRSIKQ